MIAIVSFCAGISLVSFVAGAVIVRRVAKRRIAELESQVDELNQIAADNLIARQETQDVADELADRIELLTEERDALLAEVETRRAVRQLNLN